MKKERPLIPLGAETWNAQDPMTDLYHGSANRPVIDDCMQRGRM